MVVVAVASGCGCMEGVGRNGGLIPVLVVWHVHAIFLFSFPVVLDGGFNAAALGDG
jgi:hypothetical protein